MGVNDQQSLVNYLFICIYLSVFLSLCRSQTYEQGMIMNAVMDQSGFLFVFLFLFSVCCLFYNFNFFLFLFLFAVGCLFSILIFIYNSCLLFAFYFNFLLFILGYTNWDLGL